MTITRTTYTERVLIVLNPDGTLKGAHSEAVEIVRDGDEVLSAKQVPAAPIDATALASVLPDQAALVAQVAALTAERDALVAQAGQAQQAQAAASVSPYQAKMALLAAGLLDDVDNSRTIGAVYGCDLHRDQYVEARRACDVVT